MIRRINRFKHSKLLHCLDKFIFIDPVITIYIVGFNEFRDLIFIKKPHFFFKHFEILFQYASYFFVVKIAITVYVKFIESRIEHIFVF